MTSRIELSSGGARAELLPEQGAALSALEANGLPVLRPWSGRPEDGPFAVASIVLAPFSNRISRPFPWEGGQVSLPRNLSTEACPIHGDAFQRSWQVAEQDRDRAALQLNEGAFGPIRYEALLTYALAPTGLHTALTLTNRSDGAWPFGVGFHPWFPRNAATRLEFAADGVWEEDKDHLPVSTRPAPVPAAWDFAVARPLPEGWINNAFDAWDGRVRVTQGDAAASVTMTASLNLRTLVVFSPGATADFFCAEPVSHPVDAHNLPGMPGLAVLAPGEELTASMDLHWDGYTPPWQQETGERPHDAATP